MIQSQSWYLSTDWVDIKFISVWLTKCCRQIKQRTYSIDLNITGIWSKILGSVQLCSFYYKEIKILKIVEYDSSSRTFEAFQLEKNFSWETKQEYDQKRQNNQTIVTASLH